MIKHTQIGLHFAKIKVLRAADEKKSSGGDDLSQSPLLS